LSIAVPSDLVLDVAQAADPQRLQEATARLARLAAGAPDGTAAFGDALQQVKAAALPSGGVSTPVMVPDDRPTHAPANTLNPYQKFESLVLQNFVEAMLPQNDDLFGDAASAGSYRSMLADQLATQLAKSGRIGIAQTLERAHHAGLPTPAATASARASS
jgi:peptidoglycan hydrolase FlgJ